MAKSRKTKPSFDEPAKAAGAGDTGWVYRTEPAPPPVRPAKAPAPAPVRAVVAPAAARTALAVTPAVAVPAASQDIVDRHALYAAAAGLVPMPIVDVAAIGAVQLSMVRALAEHYRVAFDGNRGKALITALSSGAISTAAGRSVLAGLMKLVPVAGTVFSVATMPAFASAATHALGRVCMNHFSAGGTLETLDLRHAKDAFDRHLAA